MFSWGADVWDRPGRESAQLYCGRLTTDLPVYSPTTLNLKTYLHIPTAGPPIRLHPCPQSLRQQVGLRAMLVKAGSEHGGGALALALTWAAMLSGTVVAVLSAVLPYSLELAACVGAAGG
ncbi:DUF2199 domain-containing protein [Streptomyces sp. AC602_WCS936]|uniref:DUF2199 domain-containing protein n=1 Tax=Streptomyces sp. AC602_WCS936 TaxID=2823685 RepID=UPI0020B75A81|nr:DUF2199 domain-containing protein [Streptomyces sp. AC602_WCS936]